MSERKDERWLDEQLKQAVDGAKPVFDAESWQGKYSREYHTLLSRSGGAAHVGAGAGRIVRLVLARPWGALAVAATLIVVAGVLLLGRLGPDSHRAAPGPTRAALSPAQMMTMMSLQAAYRQGGTEALERQFDQALKMLGPRTTSISSKELLES